MLFRRVFVIAMVVLAGAISGVGRQGVRADSPTPLAQKMRIMAAALADLSHPGEGTTALQPLDDLKQLKDAATDCLEHSDDLAPAELGHDPRALQAFKAEFSLLVSKIGILESALELPANAPNRAAQIKAALDAIAAVKAEGHEKFNNG